MDFSAKGFVNKDTCGHMTQQMKIIFENVSVSGALLDSQALWLTPLIPAL